MRGRRIALLGLGLLMWGCTGCVAGYRFTAGPTLRSDRGAGFTAGAGGYFGIGGDGDGAVESIDVGLGLAEGGSAGQLFAAGGLDWVHMEGRKRVGYRVGMRSRYMGHFGTGDGWRHQAGSGVALAVFPSNRRRTRSSRRKWGGSSSRYRSLGFELQALVTIEADEADEVQLGGLLVLNLVYERAFFSTFF